MELCGVCVLIMFLSSAHTTEPIAIGNFEGYLTHWKALGVSAAALCAAKKSLTATEGL